MKIKYCSDIHLEFNGLPIKKNKFKIDSDTILLVAGDTVPTCYLAQHRSDGRARSMKKMFCQFLNMVKKSKAIYFVMGNHEHYQGCINYSKKYLQDFIDDFVIDEKEKGNSCPIIKVLENDVEKIDKDIYLFGATLWTDMNRNCPITHQAVTNYMNDFQAMIDIVPEKNGAQDWGAPTLFTTHDAYEIHNQTKTFFESEYEKIILNNQDAKIVVMTHHAPSLASYHGSGRNPCLGDFGYASDLSEWILNRPNIKFWIHGHLHNNSDYMIGNCNVLSNQRGYGTNWIHDRCFDIFTLEKSFEI